MIHFNLRCRPAGHSFDGWFRSGEDFERQTASGFVECPHCGASEIDKALMAPAVSSAKAGEPAAPTAGGALPPGMAEAYGKLQALAREVRASGHYVGNKFAEEARRIHFGESEARRIYGEATGADVKALAEDGIAALPLPPLPEDGH